MTPSYSNFAVGRHPVVWNPCIDPKVTVLNSKYCTNHSDIHLCCAWHFFRLDAHHIDILAELPHCNDGHV